jgi:hypothetical protein
MTPDPLSRIRELYMDTPYRALYYLGMAGWTVSGDEQTPMLGIAGIQHRYQVYENTYTPRPAPDWTTTQQVLQILRTLPELTGGEFHAEFQKSRRRLASMDPGDVSTSASVSSDEKAIRVLRSRKAHTPDVSRLTLTIDGGTLTGAVASVIDAMVVNDCVENWKMMMPDGLGKRPDDIVIYLNQPLGNAAVAELTRFLVDENSRHPFLCDGMPPLGMERLAPGIYGADRPLAKHTSTGTAFSGSHGDDRSKIVTEALRLSRESGQPFEDCLDQVLGSVGLDSGNPARRK